MSNSVPPDQQVELATRIASTLELYAKAAGLLALLWGFIAKAWKPFVEWRRVSQAKAIREVLAPELKTLTETASREDDCASRMEIVLGQMRDLFGDHDHLVMIAMDNRDRLDETNDLLTGLGLAADRRHDDRKQLIEDMIERLDERRKDRRSRAAAILLREPPPPSHTP